MKTREALVMVSMMAVAAMGAERRTGMGECVAVRLEDKSLVSLLVLFRGEDTATRVFADIGVFVQWKDSASRPAGAVCPIVEVQLDPESPEKFSPDAMAYALPYKHGGTQIHIFMDRVLRSSQVRQKGAVLGYVISHEIGHVLEGIKRHSDKGVMKALWTSGDFSEIFVQSLKFSGEDVDLIRLGFSKRRETAWMLVLWG
jgi:hypothetical protein